MKHISIYLFITIMWLLILAGCGILVLGVSKISVDGYGYAIDFLISSIIKAIIAILFVVIWVSVLTKLKNMIFQKQIKS